MATPTHRPPAQFPFRTGATSYVIADDLLPNARYLAGKVEDMELVLFDLEGGASNLPDAATIQGLQQVAQESGLSYTVHLPLDIRLGENGDAEHISLREARQVIRLTRALQPWTYIVHLDGREVRSGASRDALQRWQGDTLRALELLGAWAGGLEHLAVENLEGYPPDFVAPFL